MSFLGATGRNRAFRVSQVTRRTAHNGGLAYGRATRYVLLVMRTLPVALTALVCACAPKVQTDTTTQSPAAEATPTPASEAAPSVDPVPDMFGELTPQIAVDDVGAALEFYGKAFGATEVLRLPGPDGVLVHGEVKVGDSIVMIDQSNPGAQSPKTVGGTPMTLHLYVPDSDAAWKLATDAGATVVLPLEDMFWGDRYGEVEDPFGHRWAIASHTEDLTGEQMGQRAALAGEEMAAGEKPTGKKKKQPKWKSVAGTPTKTPVPEGYATLTMSITVDDAAASIEFLTSVLGGTARNRMPLPDGRLMHAEVVFGDSVLMLADELAEEHKSAKTLGGSPVMIYHYTPDASATHAKAVESGAQSLHEPADMFWGDRYAAVMGPGGIAWSLATHIKDVSVEEMSAQMNAQAAPSAPTSAP